jgi:hypothetical protein
VAGRITYRRVATALLLALSLFAAALVVYGACLRVTAKALINSAKAIHTTADAEREIAAWRGHRLITFYDQPPLPANLGGDKVYEVQVLNTVLSRLRIVQPRALEMALRLRSGELRSVSLIFINGPAHGTSIAEWFVPDPARRFHVVHNYKPWGAHVEFSSDLPESQRVKAFGFNVNCLVKLWNCDKAEDVLPGVWQLDAAPQ